MNGFPFAAYQLASRAERGVAAGAAAWLADAARVGVARDEMMKRRLIEVAVIVVLFKTFVVNFRRLL